MADAVDMPSLTSAEVDAARVALIRRTTWTHSVPLITPQFTAPSHQRRIVSAFRAAFRAARGLGPPVFELVSCPPQTAKTETAMHCIARWLSEAPQDYLAYISYGQDLSDKKSRRIRDYARVAGVDLRDDASGVQEWHTTSNGGLLARGWQGGITGQDGLACVVLDDLYKNMAQAMSSRHRDKVDEEVRASIMTRLGPRTSVICFATRWHKDDQTARFRARDPKRWRYSNAPAISPDGVPFWHESGRTLEFYEERRVDAGDWVWASLYMGEPPDRGGTLFTDGYPLYTELPYSCRYVIGVDMAYSESTSADWTAAVVLAVQPGSKRAYVVEVAHQQADITSFVSVLKRLRSKYGTAPIHWYAYGPEKGVTSFFKREGVPIHATSVPGDKFVRAQATSAAWKRGDICIPADLPVHIGSYRDAPRAVETPRVVETDRAGRTWLDRFIGECLDFTGSDDLHDDMVDALVAAYDAVAAGVGAGAVTVPEGPRVSWGPGGSSGGGGIPRMPWGGR